MSKAFNRLQSPMVRFHVFEPYGNTEEARTRYILRPCPHDTFPNRARSIATSSRPVARVHTGATGTLVPVSRDHLAT